MAGTLGRTLGGSPVEAVVGSSKWGLSGLSVCLGAVCEAIWGTVCGAFLGAICRVMWVDNWDTINNAWGGAAAESRHPSPLMIYRGRPKAALPNHLPKSSPRLPPNSPKTAFSSPNTPKRVDLLRLKYL